MTYELRVAPTAARALRVLLPEAVAEAVVEFITGDLLVEPTRVGKPLLRELEGVFSARRGVYRVLYEIDHEGQMVNVLDIAHRSDAYRRR
ncbi:MAG: mRNA interferase RelE/StbE [Frankiaceae bacterium]|nr:mRNA interferase RelE/StbE [Frankiaceae bacterium]